ncbi:hypothetical protein TWF788_001869 [Orbilia oligospora]|uniref:Uncharacterized protein n=1 Tax=Orbilia oligospora TaxID=2813651 RepID=A0A6G1M337_ORBOL|nr:hypothetical protein TWF788_001869 [Orbilia oligospora]KAF3210193.1 hypothetical protein TWF679_006941 [Orbilia oligospora]KAF3230249.1 hypothetical protein TWF191_010946 [Orbilia oligospora]KAF3241973.1 hypothetical protein TWF192_008747 [Orbilia oligospora]
MGLSAEAIIALVTLLLGLPLLFVGIFSLRLQIQALENQRGSGPVGLFNSTELRATTVEIMDTSYRCTPIVPGRFKLTPRAYKNRAQTSLNFAPRVPAV